MKPLVKYTYVLGGWYALSGGLLFGGEKYYRAALTAGMMLFWVLLADKLRRGVLTLASMVKLFLALAALYLLMSVDYAMEGIWIYAVLNLAASLTSFGVSLWVNRKVAR